MRGFGAYVAALGLVVVSAQSSQYSDFTSLVSVYDSATCNTTALFSQGKTTMMRACGARFLRLAPAS